MSPDLKLSSSNSLEGIAQTIAEFYGTSSDRITLIDSGDYWAVQSGTKTVTPIVRKVGKRFVFGTFRGCGP